MPEAFRTICVISDLHLGGEAEAGKRGFRICTHEPALAAFIESLSAQGQPAVELVINGDSIDFLAERPDGEPAKWSAFHFPENKAIKCLDRVVARSAIVFDALKKFLARGHRLVVLPGNHDTELNLPAVRRRLREHVGAGHGADYEFIPHGEAYLAGDVLIEHGNRVDDMNFVDYSVLRRLCGVVSRGMPVREDFLFDPPAGSKLVAEVMNDIKKTYGFVDLLKPEGEAAFPVILALEPGLRNKLGAVASFLAQGKARRARQRASYSSDISAIGVGVKSLEVESTHNELENILVRTVGRADFAMPHAKPVSPSSVTEISLLDKVRGIAALLLGDRDETWESRLHDLLDALRAFQGVDSFDRSVETEAAYIDEARHLAYGPIRHVVFGHTHRAKKVSLHGEGFYFNTGTWADLLELPRGILDPTRTFAPLAELEQLARDLVENDFSRYVTFRPTYIRFEQDQNGRSIAHELADYPWETAAK